MYVTDLEAMWYALTIFLLCLLWRPRHTKGGRSRW